MMHQLQQIASKILALALLGGVCLVAYALVIEPLTSRYFDVREQIAQQRQLLGRLTAAASSGWPGQRYREARECSSKRRRLSSRKQRRR